MIIPIILTLNWTAYSQDTRTKVVKVSTLKNIGKELEKCKLTEIALNETRANFDSLVKMNINMFRDLEEQQKERKFIQSQLRQLNADYNKAVRQKKTSWITTGLGGVIVGMGLMAIVQ